MSADEEVPYQFFKYGNGFFIRDPESEQLVHGRLIDDLDYLTIEEGFMNREELKFQGMHEHSAVIVHYDFRFKKQNNIWVGYVESPESSAGKKYLEANTTLVEGNVLSTPEKFREFETANLLKGNRSIKTVH
jgi:hypothetical protein